jgi:hypothetical protein
MMTGTPNMAIKQEHFTRDKKITDAGWKMLQEIIWVKY